MPQLHEVTLAIGDKGSASSMNWMEFVSSLVGSLAWPIAAVVIAAIFHRQISLLLDKVKKLSWGDAAVELSEQLDEAEGKSIVATLAENQADEMPVQPAPVEGSILLNRRFQDAVAFSPSLAILDDWRRVEVALRGACKRVGLLESTARITALAADALHGMGVITTASRDTILDLVEIRHTAAHTDKASPADAYRFHQLADTIVKILDLVDLN